MGERDDAALPDDPDLTHAQAVENVKAAFPGAEVTTRLRTEDGRWVDPETGIVYDTFND